MTKVEQAREALLEAVRDYTRECEDLAHPLSRRWQHDLPAAWAEVLEAVEAYAQAVRTSVAKQIAEAITGNYGWTNPGKLYQDDLGEFVLGMEAVP